MLWYTDNMWVYIVSWYTGNMGFILCYGILIMCGVVVYHGILAIWRFLLCHIYVGLYCVIVYWQYTDNVWGCVLS